MRPDLYVITAGSAYVDIDVLACSIAYQELLKAEGHTALVCHTGPLNATIPAYLAKKAANYIENTPSQVTEQASFVLVDVSDPHYFEKFVDQKRIIKIFDHHFGFEDYWHSRLGSYAIIRSIGACATLIWQEYEKSDRAISSFSAELLATAILSNTLNLQASVTTDEDRKALLILEKEAQLEKNWRENYYESTKALLLSSPQKSLLSDTKHIRFEHLTLHFCQIETWHAQEMIHQLQFKKLCEDLFPGQSWLLSLLDISSGKNWLLSNETMVLESLKDPLRLEAREEWFTSEKLWLRKEILKFWQDKKKMRPS